MTISLPPLCVRVDERPADDDVIRRAARDNLEAVVAFLNGAELADGTGGQGFYTSLRDCESPEVHFARCAATPQNETIPDQWESQILARILMKHRVIFVSRPEMEQTLREMKLDYAPDLDTAVKMAKAGKDENASITVIPNGISVIVKEK